MGSTGQLVAVSAVVMGLAHTIANERIFLPLRRRLGGRETWLGYLVSCPYCASHWLAFVLVPLTGTYYVELAGDFGVVGWILRWFLSSILVTVVAAFLRIIFYLVDEGQGLLRREERVVERNLQRQEPERAEPSRDGARPS